MPIPRKKQPELMDDPTLDRQLHLQALAGLRRINRWSFAVDALWHSIRTFVHGQRLKTVRILDLACGSGDVSLSLALRAAAEGIQVEVTGCDKSAIALAEAQQYAAHMVHPYPDTLRFIELDVLQDELPADHDIVMCSLFLHHLNESDAVQLLRRMGMVTRHLVFVDDLRRSRSGYWLAWFGTRLLSRSPVVHFDGPVSVAGAFTVSEALALAEQAGLHGAQIRRHWPQRFLLQWNRNS